MATYAASFLITLLCEAIEVQNTIVQMEDYRNHLVITTENGVHVVPEGLVKDWITGAAEPDKDCVRRIIEEWINSIRALRGDCEILHVHKFMPSLNDGGATEICDCGDWR